MAEKMQHSFNGAVADDALLFEDFVQSRYLPFVRENKRSWKTDERYLASHVLPYLGALALKDIDENALGHWLATLEITGLSPSSCYRIFWLVKYILNCAVRWHVLPSDKAFKNAVCVRKKLRRPETLSPGEALALIRLLESYADRPSARAIHLLLLTGASKSEILRTRWEDVDLSRGLLVAGNTFTGRKRLIPLNNEAIKLIRRLPRRDGVPWLFSSPSGKPLVSLFYTWNMLRKKLGRPELRLADLRHSFAGFLVNMGMRQTDVVAIMGHYLPRSLELVRNNPTVNKETA